MCRQLQTESPKLCFSNFLYATLQKHLCLQRFDAEDLPFCVKCNKKNGHIVPVFFDRIKIIVPNRPLFLPSAVHVAYFLPQ